MGLAALNTAYMRMCPGLVLPLNFNVSGFVGVHLDMADGMRLSAIASAGKMAPLGSLPAALLSLCLARAGNLPRVGVYQHPLRLWDRLALALNTLERAAQALTAARVARVPHFAVAPVPRIDSLLSSIKGTKIFSCLDLAQGYWQVPPASIPLTAFRVVRRCCPSCAQHTHRGKGLA